MNKKAFGLIQHKLIPAALIAGNIALAHLIYLLNNEDYSYILILTALCLMALIIGALRANKYVLLAGIIIYTLAVVTEVIN